jgi:hypothetical protein
MSRKTSIASKIKTSIATEVFLIKINMTTHDAKTGSPQWSLFRNLIKHRAKK